MGNYHKISTLLATRRGDLQFSQVVESMGAEKAFQAFEDERATLDGEIATHVTECERMASVMDKLTDRKRSTSILKGSHIARCGGDCLQQADRETSQF